MQLIITRADTKSPGNTQTHRKSAHNTRGDLGNLKGLDWRLGRSGATTIRAGRCLFRGRTNDVLASQNQNGRPLLGATPSPGQRDELAWSLANMFTWGQGSQGN